ncbi:MAG: hypothetical protein K9N36_09960, partial [Candidatus Marinimicrobia bacterium]|nr:hypothetical protein [Candidatus Neomarinimicrobiota bacterium]
MRKLILFSMVGFGVLAGMQNTEEIYIRESGEYYWGEATARTQEEARAVAVDNLVKSISVTVQSSFEDKVVEKDGELDEKVQVIMRSYAGATLRNVETLTSRSNDRIRIFAYLSKSEVEKIFAERRRLAYELYQSGERQRLAANVRGALKQYYFAMLLLRSLPDVMVTVEGVNLTITLPEKINQIFANIAFDLRTDESISDKERQLTFDVTLNNQPVRLLDFTFWDGDRQVNVGARDGVATLALYGSSIGFSALDAQIKYEYYESRGEVPAVQDLWEAVARPDFWQQSRKKVTLKLSLTDKLRRTLSKSPGHEIRLNIPERFATADMPQEQVAWSIRDFQTGLRSDGDSLGAIGEDVFLTEKLANFLRYGRPELRDNFVDAVLQPTWHGVEVRRIPVILHYPTLNRQNTEYLVLDADSTGAAVDFNTALNQSVYKQFVENDRFVEEWLQRQTIMKFMEKYRTAYLARNLEMINQMFAENALIIVGRVIKEKPPGPDQPQYRQIGDQPGIEYLRFTKREYLARQKAIFNSQEDLLIEFNSFRIMRKEGAKNVYGVELRQNYASTTYADEGYLFLLIDFNGQDPLIYVRSWQPEEWRPEQLIK